MHELLRLSPSITLAVACIVGCSSTRHEGPTDGGTTTLRVSTYNAGLLDSVGYVPERAPLVTQALADLDVDIQCVQEFWAEEHWDGLVAASASARPHVLRLDPRPGVSGKCSPDEFVPLRSCAAAHCGSAGASDLVTCTTTECPAEVAALSSTCISCLLDNAASGDLDVISNQCLGTGGAADGGVTPPEERAYLAGGSYGIGLLSKFPLVETDHLELDSSTNRRAILYAKVDAGSGPLSVLCTHLAPIEVGVKYEGSYESWEGENRAHVKALIDWVSTKVGKNEPVLVLGDLNTGPAGKHIAPSVPDNYALLPAAGFEDPFLAGSNAACTFCVENPLVSPKDAAADADIDHILFRGTNGSATVERLFTEPVTITTKGTRRGDAGTADAGAPQAQKEIRLSDHYALRATLER